MSDTLFPTASEKNPRTAVADNASTESNNKADIVCAGIQTISRSGYRKGIAKNFYKVATAICLPSMIIFAAIGVANRINNGLVHDSFLSLGIAGFFGVGGSIVFQKMRKVEGNAKRCASQVKAGVELLKEVCPEPEEAQRRLNNVRGGILPGNRLYGCKKEYKL